MSAQLLVDDKIDALSFSAAHLAIEYARIIARQRAESNLRRCSKPCEGFSIKRLSMKTTLARMAVSQEHSVVVQPTLCLRDPVGSRTGLISEDHIQFGGTVLDVAHVVQQQLGEDSLL